MGNLTKLDRLQLDANDLTGCVPASLIQILDDEDSIYGASNFGDLSYCKP